MERLNASPHPLATITSLPAVVVAGDSGGLIGILFMNPRVGFASGASSGAIFGALRYVGIDDGVMKKLAETLRPGTAALCVLRRKMTADKVLEEIKPFLGTVIQSNLYHENEGNFALPWSPSNRLPMR